MHGNNRPRFGLFYADDLGTEFKNVSNDIFNKNSILSFSKDEAEKTNALLNNPFWAELLSDVTEEFNPDIMESRWKKSKATTKDEKLTLQTNIFSGKKDEYGIAYANTNAFFDLNARDDNFSSNDFNSIGLDNSNIRDFEDDTGKWF